MRPKMLPTTLSLLQLTDERVRYTRPVTSLDIYDGATRNFHEDGLYSVSIFGRVGTPERDQRFSYIDLKVDILQPKIYEDLIRLKGLYKGILSGKETAIFDPVLGDFVADAGPKSDTGYSFFMRHFPKLVLKRNKSPSRQQRVEFIEKYRQQATTKRAVVIPAGLRDLEVDATGRDTKDEVNDLYYRLLSVANTIAIHGDRESPVYDIPRYVLTVTLHEIYLLFQSMLEGKRGFLLNKWGSRRMVWGTRNVLSVMDPSADVLGARNAPGFTSTVVGLYQTIKALTPVTMYLLRTRYLDGVFAEGEAQVPLIDAKTFQPVHVTPTPATRERWTTKEGLLSVINSYSDVEARHRPVMVEGHYLALIYRGPDLTFRVFHDIRDLPPELDRQYVSPITLCELLYLSGYSRWNQYYITVTRYPIASDLSNYPSLMYVKTTTVGEVRRELGPDWQPMEGDEHLALEFPRRDIPSFMNTQAPHSSRLSGLVADFDGDTGSGTALMTDEATEELRRHLASRKAWVSPDGSLNASCDYDTLKLLVNNLTRRRSA